MSVEDNNLSDIPEKNFVFWKRSACKPLYTHTIYLSNNKINTLPPVISNSYERIRIWAENNPLKCDYRLGWMVSLSPDQLHGTCLFENGNDLSSIPLRSLNYSFLGISKGKYISYIFIHANHHKFTCQTLFKFLICFIITGKKEISNATNK